MALILYAKVGGPPSFWHGLQIIDLDTSEQIPLVIEVNATEGWLVRFKPDEHGNPFMDDDGKDVVRERLTGRFEIRRVS